MTVEVPYELCMLILDCLPTEGILRRQSLHAAALVSRAWSAPAQRQLFMRFTLKMGERAVDRIVRLAHLARHPRLASYVTWGHFIVDGPLNNYHEFLAIAGLAAAIFPNIRTLIMYGRALRMSGTLLLMFPAAKTIDLFDFWYYTIRRRTASQSLLSLYHASTNVAGVHTEPRSSKRHFVRMLLRISTF
jgi:hypothetical protein